MFEQDSDILVATEEENDEELNQSTRQEFVEKKPEEPIFENEESQEKVQSPTLEKETTSFVNTSYSTNNLRKVYKKYDIVQTYVPKKKVSQKKSKNFENYVKKQSSYVPERETIVVEKVSEKPIYKLSSKAKSWLFAIVSIFVLLGGLALYNAIHISNLNHDVAKAEYDITEVNKSIEKGTKTFGKLTDEDNVLKSAEDDYGMHQTTEENQITIELNEKKQVIEYQGESNFFDRVCEFFRNLFGG